MNKLHFIGVSAAQYWSALRVFGTPDVVHAQATWSVMGGIPGEDMVVLGAKAWPEPAYRKRRRLRARQAAHNIKS